MGLAIKKTEQKKSCATVRFAVERFGNLIDELKPLLELHFSEIAVDQDEIKLNPDYEKYTEMCDAGYIHVVTVRTVDSNKLVGYFITMLAVNMHYKDWLMGHNDVVFIKEEYRGHGAFSKLLDFVEGELRNLGVKKLTISCKVFYDFTSVLERHGYIFIEKMSQKLFA
jgi:GNAT superfamily N-acetyltransferase